MQTLRFYRYFLACRPDPQWYPFFQRICEALGLPGRLDLLHLTLCVIAETAERDHFLQRKMQRAFDDALLHSFAVNLSRVRAGPQGSYAHTFGPQDEIQDFYRNLVRLLRACGIEPLHRKSGLHPHMTLAYRSCQLALLKIAVEWFPTELLLIESEVGLSQHNVLGCWSLLPSRQPLLPFDNGFQPHLRGPAIVGAG